MSGVPPQQQPPPQQVVVQPEWIEAFRLFQLAQSKMNQNNPIEAIDYLKHALSLLNNEPQLYSLLGDAFSKVSGKKRIFVFFFFFCMFWIENKHKKNKKKTN